VVYTHSEEKWASKVCEAMERMAGVPFIKRIFSRMDCKDGHPEFAARKSLDWVVSQMQALDHLKWTSVDRTIFFDDDGNALGKAEADRLVHRRVADDVLGLEFVQEVLGGLDGFAALRVDLALGGAVQLLESHRGGDVFGIRSHERGVRGLERGLLHHHGRLQQIDRVIGLLVENLACRDRGYGGRKVSGAGGKSGAGCRIRVLKMGDN